MTKQEMLSTVENRMLAFWGYENTKISSVGLVMQNQTCIKGVTTKTMPDPPVPEPTLIDISVPFTEPIKSDSSSELT